MYEIVLYYKKCTEKHTNKHHNYTVHKTELTDAYLETKRMVFKIYIAPMNTGVNRV